MAQPDMPNLIQNWMEQQQKLWTDWAQHVQQAGSGAKAAQPWSQGLGQWRQAVEQTMATQREATRAWANQVAGVEGAPEEMKRLAAEGVKLLDQWTDAQQGLWQQWFELMENPGSGAAGPSKQMMAGWEQMTTQMQALQRQWAGAFSAMAPKDKGGAKK